MNETLHSKAVLETGTNIEKRSGPPALSPENDSHPLLSRGFDAYSNAIHTSSMDLLQLCPRKFLFEERFHLQLKGNYRPALHIGTIFHLAKRHLIDGASHDTIVAEVGTAQREVVESLEGEVDGLGLLPNGKALSSVLETIRKDTVLGLAMVDYVQRHHPWPHPTHWETLGTEVAIQAMWANLKSPIRGAIDHLAYDKSRNEIWIVDHKTCGQGAALDAASEYQLALQPRIYRLLATILLETGNLQVPSDAKVVGVCHNVIEKLAIRQTKKESYDEYVARCVEQYESRRNTNSPAFLRSWIRMTGPLVPRDLLLRLRENDLAQRLHPDMDLFYCNSKACRNYNSLCPYYSLCTTDSALWDDILQLRFTVEHRDDDTSDLIQIGGLKP